ncbi:conserved hypothetical protein [Desulfamplus magnetovallimortis]|uniref:Transcription regulator TrmB N-terminal domain-containing protein n=1 Tax=Desulfamplus magnetovallimortis TaxID=1246637 RepID=A0A1W1HJ32_9BACT|nr:TrmB family transcriptional regulator [Desulfamplus magnetovallimortis]SLM32470.1 conserved hypothetical protein [Desulfamplus magnetovallimortis]
MFKRNAQLTIGLSEYAVTAFTALVAKHPVNGSQLSRNSGIPRARIYDVLRVLKSKGFVVESSEGMYTPIPPEELIRRLRNDHENSLSELEEKLKNAQQQTQSDVIWNIKGYEMAMAKAQEMISDAAEEVYVRISPEEGKFLDPELKKAAEKGVQIKYISLKPVELTFEWQVIHPPREPGMDYGKHRFFDVVVDRKEVLCGMFMEGDEANSIINWGKNKWFVISVRDSLRHDFFHYFLHKIMNDIPLSASDKALYKSVCKDI